MKYRKIQLVYSPYISPRIYAPLICNQINIPNINPPVYMPQPSKYKLTLMNFGNINVDRKIYILDVPGSPGNVIAVYLCYFFIK